MGVYECENALLLVVKKEISNGQTKHICVQTRLRLSSSSSKFYQLSPPFWPLMKAEKLCIREFLGLDRFLIAILNLLSM